MSRCLHVTIHEGSAAAPRHATAGLPGRNGHDPAPDYVMPRPDDPAPDYVMPRPDDPAADYVMPRPDDPAPDYVMPRPDDPAPDYVMPRPDDPSSRFIPAGGYGGWGKAVAEACPCSYAPAVQDPAAPRTPATPHPFIGPRDYSGFVIVRMAPDIESAEAQTLWDLAQNHEPQLTGLKAVLEPPPKPGADGQVAKAQTDAPPEGTLVSRRLMEPFRRVEEEATASKCDSRVDRVRELEKKTAGTAFAPLHSLASYWRLDLRQHSARVEEVVAQLNTLAEVGLAYRELAATDPQDAANGHGFSDDQGYLGDAPTGISASWARERLASMDSEPAHGVQPEGRQPSSLLTLCDLEQGWNLDHKELSKVAGPLFGLNRTKRDQTSGDHGTAVLGQLAADGNNGFGVRGVAAGHGRFVLASHYGEDGSNGHVAAAIVEALDPETSSEQVPPLQPGDILLIEVQRGRLPAEVDEADFNAIRLAAGRGIIVIEAAGNGGFDLDAYSDPGTGRSLRRGDPRFRDSGAILVGAARAGLPHDRAPFSNYGSRLDCYGWGEAVTTSGYGDLAGTGVKDSYTNSFSGTSSASPIVAGAAALLQILHHAHTGERLEPRAMREILRDPTTGTPQGPNVPGHIGVMPDLKAIVRDRLQLVPDVYLRRSIGDDGALPAPGDEISSSPDILVSSQELEAVGSLFGEGSPGENLAAPGEPVVPGAIYLRLRNRGLGEGKVHVQLFASPAATLITPERRFPVSPPGLEVGAIPQGDTLIVAGPIHWQLPVSGPISTETWSLLAILSEPKASGPPGVPYFDGTGGMPPGPPYFDWAEYRAFLRGPGVAWRNTHRNSDASPTLPFFIAGTPDHTCYFDFEVIQRLPAGAKVSLELPPALSAKLRQRVPWLGERDELFLLPERPRTRVRGVELAAGTYAPTIFKVQPGKGGPLKTGHSLALRQLWRGEEVGRITWFFGPLD